jgi:hypothetical protein
MAVASKEALAGKSMVRVWRVPLPSAVGFLYQDKVPTLSYEVQAAEAIESIALSHDGTHLATASMPIEGVWPHLDLQVWSFSRDALVREACRRIGRNLTPQEWATHIPGKPYKAICTAQALQTTSTALTESLQLASTKNQAPGLNASPASPAESKQKPSLPAVAPHVSAPAQPPASAPATDQAAPGSASNSVALPQTENPYPIFNTNPQNLAQNEQRVLCKLLNFCYRQLSFRVIMYCSAVIVILPSCALTRSTLSSQHGYTSNPHQQFRYRPGIASASKANIDWLKSQGYRYLVVSRARARHFNPAQAIDIETATGDTVRGQKVLSEDGQEVRLFCYSEARGQKEEAIAKRFCEAFEAGLRAIADGLSLPRTEKRITKLWERHRPTQG